jgi:hypothetical protein
MCAIAEFAKHVTEKMLSRQIVVKVCTTLHQL